MKCRDLNDLLSKLPANKKCRDAMSPEKFAEECEKLRLRGIPNPEHQLDTAQDEIFSVWICKPISKIEGNTILRRCVWHGTRSDKPSDTRIILLPFGDDLKKKYAQKYHLPVEEQTLRDLILDTKNWEEITYFGANENPKRYLRDLSYEKNLDEYIAEMKKYYKLFEK